MVEWKEFKESLLYLLEEYPSVPQLAVDIEVSQNCIRNWKRAIDDDNVVHSSTARMKRVIRKAKNMGFVYEKVVK